MSDDAEADIVLQLDALATYAERANHWTDDKRLMDAAGVADTVFGAIHRIEELEAKLARAEWLLIDAEVQLEDGKIKTRRNRAELIRQFLAELKGLE